MPFLVMPFRSMFEAFLALFSLFHRSVVFLLVIFTLVFLPLLVVIFLR